VIRIWVNPTPEIRVSADTVLCDGETATFTIRNPNVFLNGFYEYDLVVTPDSPAIEGERLSENDLTLTSFDETLTNTDTVVHFVDYHFTPRIRTLDGGNDCENGLDTTIRIWVNPNPEIRVIADTVICDGETAVISVRNPNHILRGEWTFDMVATADPEISGNTGTASGTGDFIFNETLTNSDSVAHKVVYQFTPRIAPDDGGAECGGGIDTTITIWVNPTPRIAVTTPDSLVCDSSDVFFNIRNPNDPVKGAWQYNLVVDYGTFIEGNNIGGTYTDSDLNLSDYLVNRDTAAHLVTYRFIPFITPEDNGTDCGSGVEQVVNIWVNPTPQIRVSTPRTEICNEDNVNIFVRNPNIPIQGDWYYNLDVTYESGLTGDLTDGVYNSTDVVLTDQLVNTDTIFHAVTYRFTPWIDPSDGDPDCLNGLDTTIIVWVNPTPAIRVVAEDSILCNGETTDIMIRNPNSFINGFWEYNLQVIPEPGITGNSAGGLGLTDTTIYDPLINNDTVVRSVQYIFTPVKTPDPDVCAGGNDTTIVIWVNPTPEIRVNVSDTILCDGDNITLQGRNPNVPIRGTWDATMEVLVDPGITGITAGIYPYNGDFTENYTLNNDDPVARSVTFKFHPRITDFPDGDQCNNGIDTTIVVWVNPVPDIGVTATDTLICNDELAEFQVDVINTQVQGEWLYDLDVEADPEITGARADGVYTTDSTLIQDRLFNTDTAARKVTYHFIPRIDPADGGVDCGNGRDTLITIWVNPSPRILVDFTDTIFCSNETVNIQVDDGLGTIFGNTEYIVTAIYNTSNISSITRNSNDPETRLPGPPLISDVFENLTQEAQPVFYLFTPRLIPSDGDPDCPDAQDIVVRIWINPTPTLDVEVPDAIICDTEIFEINVSTPNSGLIASTLVYDLDVTYNPVFVNPGGITPDGERLADLDITDLLINSSDTVQVITYRLTARVRDDRPGYGGEFCDNGTDTTIVVLLNPTPRLDYTLMEDSLCYDDGFTILTPSAVYATDPLFYTLGVVNDDNLTGVESPGDYPVSGNLEQDDVLNPHLNYGRLEYNILPYISSEGCLGSDTTFFIDVNPEPRMTAELSTPTDTAVCYDQGYIILMDTEVGSTTGPYVYDLVTYGYNEPLVENEQLTGDYVIVNMDETDVRNTGEVIEDITYRYIPVIRNVNGSGKNCYGNDFDSITVQVAPELRGIMTPDTTYVGDWEIRCFGLEDAMLHPNVRGGYYRDVYNFDWETDGAFGDRLVDEDSTQNGLGVGTYWYEVEDVIGCYHSDTIILDQPDEIEVPYTVVDATCAAIGRVDGSIDITPGGGTPEYEYHWDMPFGFSSDQQDIGSGVSGDYFLTMLDTNLCEYIDTIFIGAVEDIILDVDVTPYGDYEITCNGANTGEIEVSSILGGFPDYRLRLVDDFTGDTIFSQDATTSGTTITGLGAGTYTLVAYDQVHCYNANQGGFYTYELFEPDTISIIRHDAQYFHDTVDVSCYGADDGFFNIELTGGHTYKYANTFVWTGPDPDLVAGDSIQGAPGNGYLSGGDYNVHITDRWGCEQSADYTLFEPSRIQLDVDSVRTLNGWNITCFGDNDGFIEISSSGGILGHDYAWGPGAMSLPDPTQQDIYDLVADTFHLTITDSIGCTLDTVFEIRQPNELGLQETIPRINDWEIACAGDSTGEITLTPLGGADSTDNTYLWSTPDGYISDPASRNQTNLPEGNYEVLVTDINGCSYQTSFELLDPDPMLIESLTADSAFCAGTASGKVFIEASGGVDPFVYLWGGPDGYSSTDPDSITDLYAGVYTITLTDDNLCVKDSLIEVFEADRFDVAMSVDSDYNGADISCDGYADGVLTIAPVGGTGPYFYAWNTGATTPTVTGLPEGTYSVVVNDKHGCIDSAKVTIVDPDPIAFNMYTEDPACHGDSTGRLEFLVTGGTTPEGVIDYRVWVNDLVNGTVVENLPAGVYQIRVLDKNNCEADTSAELLDNPPIEIAFETENAFCPEKRDGQLDLLVDGGVDPYLISWSGDLPDNEYYFNEVRPGQYIVSVTDFNECVMTDTVEVGYTYESCLVIPNAFSPNGDGFNDLWIIEGLELYTDPEIRVFDRWGSRVYYSPNPVSDPWNGTFNGRRLPIDSYHYVIDLKNNTAPITGNITIVR